MKVNAAYKSYFVGDKRFNILYGGGGSGKSYAIAEKKVKKIVSHEYVKEIILRKNFVSLKDSCYALLQRVIVNENLQDDFYFTTSPLEILYIPTGNKFLFRGMKDEKDREKVKSIVDPTGAWMEEANEFDREDLTQINLRVRGGNLTPKDIDISFNPIDEDHWLKDRFFDNPTDPDNTYILRTTYKDNAQFLDSEYIDELEKLINEDENLYNIYTLGQWGTIDARGRIYKSFDATQNICEYKYNDDLPIILCCDFNVDPMKWALIQNVGGIDYIFDELVKADTDTESMVSDLLKTYGHTQYEIYGDYSGTFRHTSSRTTDYDIIKQYIPNAAINIQPNPPVIERINTMNWRLRNKTGKRSLMFDKKAVHSIADMKRVKFKEGTREEDKNLEKYDGRNPINSLVHISSAIGYYLVYKYSIKGKPSVTISRAR
jgi:phage terminase large subunit